LIVKQAEGNNSLPARISIETNTDDISRITAPIGDGWNPSPSGEERFFSVPKGLIYKEYPPSEDGGLILGFKRAAKSQLQLTIARTPRLIDEGCLVTFYNNNFFDTR